MKNNIYIPLILLTFLIISCSEIVDVEPSFKLNSENGITNSVNAKAAVNGIYSTLQGSEYDGGMMVAMASRSGFVDWSLAEYAMTWSQSGSNSTQQYKWQKYYETINAANFAINGISNLSDAQISEEEKKVLLGESRLLRAWGHIFVLQQFSHWWASDDNDPDGVMYREETVTLENVHQARLNVGESYQKIFEDLDYAIANAPSFSGSRYMSKEFAKVLKAKLLLFRAGFNTETTGLDEALSLVNEVLNASIPGFSMQGDMAQVYEDSWDSPENLFSGYIEESGRDRYTSSWYRFSLPFYDSNRVALTNDRDAKLKRGFEWFSTDPRWDVVTGYCWPKSNREVFTFTKVTRLGDWGEDTNTTSTPHKYNTYFFRYPELYILKAELLARTGASIAEAVAPINTMRAVRTNPVIPSLNPTTKEELMEDIFKEYFFETFVENGSEYFASTRFKDSSGARWIENLRGEGALEIFRLCYNIPSIEMELNNLIHQNDQLD
ncbi:MAG: RagB/SusD family nutrient uptake outer membrane protein [Polaribacter sp.]|uniref:RagB/SusD family nutrient uptake outer membrane protein n=1 Tax=Polaribacter sp. TaxID=1920175 RepID=UPI003265BD65